MENTKQTAAKWLVDKFNKTNGQLIESDFEQAIQMEKQQIIDAANLPIKDRWYDATKYSNVGEQYYNKKFTNESKTNI